MYKECGANIRSTIEKGHKQVTVPFGDASSFIWMFEKLAAEDVHAPIERCLELLIDNTRRYVQR